MNKKGLTALQRLINDHGAGCLDYVVTARDAHVVSDFCDEILQLCAQAGIPCYMRLDAPSPATDVTFAIGWRWLLSVSTQLVVFHDSLLPRYRGFAPLVTSLIRGEPRIGVTALLGAAGYDEGNILLQASVAVAYPLKIADAIDAVSLLYGDLASKIVHSLREGRALVSHPQDPALASYSVWRDDDDYAIDWHQDASTIQRFIDAVGHPYKGASARAGDKIVRILDAEVAPDVTIENRCVGKVIFMQEGFPSVICGRGLLRLRDVRSNDTLKTLLPWPSFRTRFA